MILAMVFSLVFSSVAIAAPKGERISNELELTVTVEKVEESTIRVNEDLSTASVVGLYDCFTVSTTPGDNENVLVRGKLEVINGPADGFKLEYVEQNSEHSDYGKYLSLPVDENGVAWFGPATGFPLGAVNNSMLRVTWNTAGEYMFLVSIMYEENFNTELASTTVEVTVVEGKAAMALEHATAGAGEYAGIKDVNAFMAAIASFDTQAGAISKNIKAGKKFDYVVVADLDNNVSHVDNALFVFEVTKEGGTISKDDFEITAISLREGTEGINDTFEVVENVLRGFWGPSKGFPFVGEAATAFTVKFNSEGTYTVNTYAIQVAPAEKADL